MDFGTATNLDTVSADGAYLGGAIMPGMGIALDALVSQAALLTAVELTQSGSVIGRTTPDALRSGALLGCAAQTDGIVGRFVRLLGEATRVIATGGLAPLVAPFTRSIQVVDPHLTLTGLRLLHERAETQRNRGAKSCGGGEDQQPRGAKPDIGA